MRGVEDVSPSVLGPDFLMAVLLTLHPAQIDALLKGPDSPVTRNLITRVARFQKAAREQVHSNTGCLESSILWRFIPGGGIRVISDTAPCSPSHTSYSLFVHEGTKPHVIRPKKAKLLAFEWDNGPNGPGMYFFGEVHHPGTQPNRFFTDNIPALAG